MDQNLLDRMGVCEMKLMPKLTDEEVDSLQAGRRLDVIIAREVFGYQVVNIDDEPYIETEKLEYASVPEYSTDVSAAWEVIQKMVEAKVLMNISYGTKTWNVNFSTQKQYRKLVYDSSTAETITLAICRAALKSCQ